MSDDIPQLVICPCNCQENNNTTMQCGRDFIVLDLEMSNGTFSVENRLRCRYYKVRE